MLPQLNRIRKAVTDISIFRGLNRSVNTGLSTISSNNSSIYTEFKDMKNLCSDNYPQLSTRKGRTRLQTINDAKIISNILSVNGGLIYLDSAGNLFHNGTFTQIDKTVNTEIEHNLVQFGNNVLIFPDKKSVNLTTEKLTNLEQITEEVKLTSTNINNKHDWAWDCSIEKVALNTSLSPRNKVATIYNYIDFNDESNQKTLNNVNKYEWLFNKVNVGDTIEEACSVPSVLWMCTSSKDSSEHYSGQLKKFTEITNYYVRIFATNIGLGFKKGDFVKIYGMEHNFGSVDSSTVNDRTYIDALNNKTFKIYDVKNNYIVIKANIETSVPYFGKISISRTVPDLDEGLIMEVDNRLWGCNSENNEIYACKQGDATNWYAYSDGISTDSFAMTVGSEGAFTGIARQNSSIIFFKENWVLKIYGTKPSNFTLASYNVSGVENGSRKSVVWINGVLFYKTKDGIVQYSPGAQPQLISNEAFGNTEYINAVGGRHKNKYYVSMQNREGETELFVFDYEKDLWHKEDETQMLSTVTYNDVMYYIDNNTGFIMTPDSGKNLLDITAVNPSSEDKTGEFFTYNNKTQIYGDVDGDGIISNNDYQLIQQYITENANLSAEQFKRADVTDDGTVNILDVTALKKYINSHRVEREGAFEWYCETGDLYDSDFDTKYISRIEIGMKPDKGTKVRLLVQYDDNGNWIELSKMLYDSKKPRVTPVSVRRADYLRLRIEGEGKCEIYGISITYAKGSDIR